MFDQIYRLVIHFRRKSALADIGLWPLPPYNKFRTRRRAEERSDIRQAKLEERSVIRREKLA